MNKFIILIFLSIIFCQCASDPIMRVSFYNDLEMTIIQRSDTVDRAIVEKNIEKFETTSYVTIGTWPTEINKNTIEKTLLIVGYNDLNRLLYIYVNEDYYVVSPELLSNILVDYGIIDREKRIYYIKISELFKCLGVNYGKHNSIIFYYRNVRE